MRLLIAGLGLAVLIAGLAVLIDGHRALGVTIAVIGAYFIVLAGFMGKEVQE